MVRRRRHGRPRQRRRRQPHRERDAARQRAEPAAASRRRNGARGRSRKRPQTTPRTRTWARPSSPFASRIGRRRSPGSATAAPTCGAASTLRQLTRDHSYLEVLREQENLSRDAAARPSEQESGDADARHRHAGAFVDRPSRCAGATGCSCAATVSTTSWRMRRSPKILRTHQRAGCCRRCADRRGAGARRTRQRQRRAWWSTTGRMA